MTFWQIALLFVIFVVVWWVCNLIFLIVSNKVQQRQREQMVNYFFGHIGKKGLGVIWKELKEKGANTDNGSM